MSDFQINYSTPVKPLTACSLPSTDKKRSVTDAFFGQAKVKGAYGDRNRLGVAEEDFEGAFRFGHSNSVFEFRHTKLI